MNVLIRQILSGILFVPLLVMSFVSWSGSGESDSVAVGSFPSSLQTVFETAINKEFESAPEKAGISVAVYSGDRVWVYSRGVADTQVEMTVDTLVPVGSTSKTFVSALVLIQVKNGLYDLSDPLEGVLSGHVDYSSFDFGKINPEVTVEELLSMRSGLPNYNKNRQGVRKLFKRPEWRPADNVNLVQDSYKRSGVFDYNDTNLVLLGLIAEFHGGQDIHTLYQQTFFDPLDIRVVFPPQDTLPPNVARPYGDRSPWAKDFGNIIDAAPFSFDHYWFGQGRIRWPCCGLISTPKDMARWAYELYSVNGSAISFVSRKNLLKSLSSRSVLYQGIKQPYGYFATKRIYTLPRSINLVTYGHPGGGGGYSSLLRYAPELDLSVSVLANSLLQFGSSCPKLDIRHCIASRIFSAYGSHTSGTTGTSNVKKVSDHSVKEPGSDR